MTSSINFTSPSLSGYNASPPPNDGSTGANNQVDWSKHIDKIGDPLRTYLLALAAECAVEFGVAASEITSLQSSLSAATGTAMLFYQASAPTGWTKVTVDAGSNAVDDVAIRIVNGSSGGSNVAGASSFSSSFGASATTDGHTLTAAQSGLPAHNHTIEYSGTGSFTSSNNANMQDKVIGAFIRTTSTENNSAQNASQAHSHGMPELQYVDCILATKD